MQQYERGLTGGYDEPPGVVPEGRGGHTARVDASLRFRKVLVRLWPVRKYRCCVCSFA